MFFSRSYKSSSHVSSPGRSSPRSRVSKILRLIVNALILLFFFGKALMLPIGVALSPVSNSHINRLDLMIITPGYMSEVNRGDLVLACRSGWWNTACVLGVYDYGGNGANGNGAALVKVLSNGNSSTTLFVVNGDLRLFKVHATVSVVIWAPLLTLYLFYLVYEVKEAFRKRRVLGENNSLVVLSLVLIISNTFIVGATYVDQSVITYSLPGISIKDEFFLDNSSLLITFETSGDYVIVDAECVIPANGHSEISNGFPYISKNNGEGNVSMREKGLVLETRIVDQRAILAEIPLEVYFTLFNQTRLEELPVMPAVITREEFIPTRCRLVFDRFELVFNTYAKFSWRDLNIYIEETGRLVVENKNPVSINISLMVFDIDREIIIYRESHEIPRLGSFELNILDLGASRARIIVEYELLGLNRIRVGYYEN